MYLSNDRVVARVGVLETRWPLEGVREDGGGLPE
jgi:hypothetical protein